MESGLSKQYTKQISTPVCRASTSKAANLVAGLMFCSLSIEQVGQIWQEMTHETLDFSQQLNSIRI
jgi:hypothetical protein